MSVFRWTLVLVALCTAEARAQRVMLELRPRMGDTLRMRLDQTTEMSVTRKGFAPRSVTTTLEMFSRAIVEASADAFALILAVTDSADVRSNDERGRPVPDESQRLLVGTRMRLRLAPDGTVSIAERQAPVPREVNDLVSVMPASFPRGSVAVGDTWLREMPIPPTTALGVPLGGVVKAAFRLDSVSRDADVAYLSMRGTLLPGASDHGTDGVTGSVNGNMIVDRRRGWLSESRFLIEMRATMVSLGNTRAAIPLDFRMRITQHMRVFSKR
jgi:hypothetical protein